MKKILIFLGVLAGCNPSSKNQEGATDRALADFDRLGLLQEINDNVMVPRLQSFQWEAEALQAATENLCQKLEAGMEWNTAAVDAQNRWKSAMGVWQEIEVFQLGPLSDQAGTLRYDIYTWPLVNACAVDRQVGLMASNPAAYFLSDNDSTKSLSALEYLLFDNDSLHACKASVTETQAWNERPGTERQALRCRYLSLLATDLRNQATLLQQKWNNDSNGYRLALVAEAPQTELQKRLNQITDSLFYLDSVVKDRKLGAPLGLHSSCNDASCPDQIEHAFSQQGLSAVHRNLQGFQAVFTGGDTGSSASRLGFDDFLAAAGGEALATRMKQRINDAVTTAEKLANETSLLSLITGLDKAACKASTVEQRNVEICAFYQEIKAITDEWKTEFVDILQLTTPAQSSGDND